jgi:hypothetical protein
MGRLCKIPSEAGRNLFREECHESIDCNKQRCDKRSPFADGAEGSGGLDRTADRCDVIGAGRMEVDRGRPIVRRGAVERGEMDPPGKRGRSFGIAGPETVGAALSAVAGDPEGVGEGSPEQPQTVRPATQPVGRNCGGRIPASGPWSSVESAPGPAVDSATGVFVTKTDLPVCTGDIRRGRGIPADDKKNFWR